MSSLIKYTDVIFEQADITLHDKHEMGCGFVSLSPMWSGKKTKDSAHVKAKIFMFDSAVEFDQHGQTVEPALSSKEVR